MKFPSPNHCVPAVSALLISASSAAIVSWNPTPANLQTLNAGGSLTNLGTGVLNAFGDEILMSIAIQPAGSALNLSSTALGGNQFDTHRAKDIDNSGSVWVFTFSESIQFEVSSQTHSFFGDNEIITVSSTAPVTGSLFNVQPTNTLTDVTTLTGTSGGILVGSGTTTSVTFRGGRIDSTSPGGSSGTYWTVTGTGVTSLSVLYRREFEPNVSFPAGREPFTLSIVATTPIPEPKVPMLLGTVGLGFLMRRRTLR